LAKIKSGELLGSFVQAKTSGMMGSPFYMAPEQWSDDEPDARADIYSLGIILYQMLAGDVPFKGSSIPSIMKKHLTLPPPSFKSAGVDVPARLEAVVRHALEKEISARTPSVEVFIKELREAVAAGGITIQSGRQTAPVADETMYAPASTTVRQQGTTDSHFDLMDGTVSSSALGAEEQAKLAAAREAHEHEQKEKERVAHQELARESEELRKAEEEKDRQRKEQEERVLKEQEERETRERQQREQMERVERQAKELEERLARLATSMPPQPGGTTVIDPESTQVHQGVRTQTAGDNSLPGANAAATLYDSASPLVVTIPPKPKSNSMLILGAAVLVIVLVGGAIGAYLLTRTKTTSAGPGGSPTPTTSPGLGDVIKADLVEIPGGSFQMGRNDGPLGESPAHPIAVRSFFMDKTEVTNAEYAEFVRDSHHAPPDEWNGTKPAYGTELWPVTGVSFEDVNAFAGWRSKRDNVTYRLPTEEEWEYAARNGDRSDLYPWGKDWKDNQAVLKEATPAKVGSHPEGNNKWGVADLIGNVWEWTSSSVSAYPGNPTPIPTATREWLVIRGAGYDRNPSDRDNPVSSCIRTFVSPGSKIPQLGFRLVRSSQ
jgi:formylglycine-generating enzyme required for sulfatase activity